MSLTTLNNTVPYDVSGGYVATYPIPFPYFNETEIKVTLLHADGSETEPTYSTDYSVSAPGVSGTLTIIGTWAAAERMTIERLVALTQPTDLVNGQTEDADVVETQHDREVAMIQQVDEKIGRQITFPISDNNPNGELPAAALRSLQFLIFDVNGDAGVGGAITAYPVSVFMQGVVAAASAAAARALLVTPPLESVEQEITAAVNITEDKAVFLDGSGEISHTPSQTDRIRRIFQSTFSHDTVGQIKAAALSETEFVVAYSYTGTGRAIYGKFAGDGIDWGTPVEFDPGAVDHISIAALTATKIVIAYQESTGDGEAIVGDIAASVINFGSADSFKLSAGTTLAISMCAMSASRVLIAYGNSTDGKGLSIVGDVSGTSFSWGAESEFYSAYTQWTSVTKLNTDEAVVAYKNVGTTFGEACYGSGTTSITWSGAWAFTGVDAELMTVGAYDITHVAIAYRDDANNKAEVIAASINTGTGAFSWGTVAEIGEYDPTNIALAVLSSTRIVVSWGNTLYGQFTHLCDLSGTVITKHEHFNVTNDKGYHGANINMIALSSLRVLITADQAAGIVAVYDVETVPAAGIAVDTVAAAAACTVITSGKVTGLSGLTPGAAYYYDEAGVPTTIYYPGKRIGIAQSATELILMRD